MKKAKQGLRKLTLKKEVISNLQEIKGGELVIATKVVVIYPDNDPGPATRALSWGYYCGYSNGTVYQDVNHCVAELTYQLRCRV